MKFERMGVEQYRDLVSSGALAGALSAGGRGTGGRGADGPRKSTQTSSVPWGAGDGLVAGVPKRRRAAVEEELQISCFKWILAHEHKYPCLKTTFHTPNGGRRSKGEAGRFKAMGVRKGVVDILNPFSSGFAPGFACELKAPNEDLTSEQIAFLKVANANGYVNGVCYSFDEFLSLIQRYLGIA